MKQLAIIAALSFIGSAFALFETTDHVLVIDAGHGGHDAGYISGDIKESDLNLAWARDLKQQAEEKGIEVVMMRDSDDFIALAARSEKIAENRENAIFISYHMQASQSEQPAGPSIVIHNDASEVTHDWALRVEAYLDTLEEIQIKKGDFMLLRDPDLTGMIINPGFMTNTADLQKIISTEHQSRFNAQLINALLKE